MTNQLHPPTECARCRQSLPADAETCPHCGLAVRKDALTPLGGTPPPPPPAPPPRWSAQEERDRLYETGPVERAPGQDAPGSWGYVKFIAKQDPVFAVVLGLLALEVLGDLGSGNTFSAIISGAVFWGVYTFQSYGFWLAMLGSGFGLLMSLLLLSTAPIYAAIGGAISLFTLVVLYLRREYFG